MDTYDVLRELMLIPAPSGYESKMAYRMADLLKPYCDTVEMDKIGNVIGKIRGVGGCGMPKTMIFGHMDQLGFIVRRIEPDGYLRVDRLGGVSEKVLPGLQLVIRSENGHWIGGVFGSKSHHATAPEEKYKVDAVTSLFVDIGAKSAGEVRALGIEIGCPAVFKPAFEALQGTRVCGTAADNRGACAALVSVAERLCGNPPLGDVYIVGTVWEEFNLRGAMIAARSVKPDVAVMLDVVLAGDTRDLNDRFETALGLGPCVQLYSFHGRGTLNGTLAHQPLYALCKQTAERENLPLQRFAALGIVTDAAYLQLEENGIPCLEMGFPTRYTHTPVEVCDVADIETLAQLAAAMARAINGDFQFSRY
jgi:putative aminopeptidase FrvX